MEAGLIAGLTSAGVPQDQAVAAIFIQRLFTAYLPPIWRWVTLAWMRRQSTCSSAVAITVSAPAAKPHSNACGGS